MILEFLPTKRHSFSERNSMLQIQSKPCPKKVVLRFELTLLIDALIFAY